MLERFVLAGSVIFIATILWIIIKNRRRPLAPYRKLQQPDRAILQQFVPFYNSLSSNQKKYFELRLQQFLSATKITGVNAVVEKIDVLLIAASAIIPVFAIENWEYVNLNEVLLYPGSFDAYFNQEGAERTRAGLVGDGPYQNIMVLSQADLRQGYFNADNRFNTGIHEFVHLVDKTDGAIDGVPEALLDKSLTEPWRQMMQQYIQQLRNGETDIDPYGGTNQAEFFAVASEYFFNQPQQLQADHPQLYAMLSTIFKYPFSEHQQTLRSTH